MSDVQHSTTEFDTLLAGVLDLRLDDAQMARFGQLLSESQAIDHYVDHAILHAMLRWEHTRPLAGVTDEPWLQPLPVITSEQPAEHNSSPSLSFLSRPLHGTIGFFPEGMPLAYSIATVVTGLGLLVGSHVYMSTPEQDVRHSVVATLVAEPASVGRITAMVDCKGAKVGWVNRSAAPPGLGVCPKTEDRRPKTLIALGDTFALSSGLMEITYDTGAKVILQGPVTYEVESNGGFLSIGKLTGKLEKGGERSPNLQTSKSPNPFVIKTPTATITDLGTEFGVEVKPNKATEVSVIRGAVEAVRDVRTGGVPVRERLVAGETIRFTTLTDPPQRISGRSLHTVFAPDLRAALREAHEARNSRWLLEPIGLVASAYHRVWDANGRLLAENDRQQAFRVATDDKFGRGEKNSPPSSSFDTLGVKRSETDFVGLRYGHLTRFDRIKVFLGRQMGDGGSWSEMPRVFILKNPVDTDGTPPERDSANWLELPLRPLFGASFTAEPDANPGAVIEIPLTGFPIKDRTGYGWAIGGVKGDGPAGYVSITELRAYRTPPQDEKAVNGGGP